MKALLLILLATSALAAVQHNGKTYYPVDATNPAMDTGAEVCAQQGLGCVGYTESSTAVCMQARPGARATTDTSGDASGVYCNGAPQTGVCAQYTNTCLSCPSCTTSVDCSTPIGGLYREMYVECAVPSNNACPVHLLARNTQDLTNEIPQLDTRLNNCATPLPGSLSRVISDGNLQLDIGPSSFTVTVANNKITGISAGAPSSCKQKIIMSEQTANTVLGSRDRGVAAQRAYGAGDIDVKGCTVLRQAFTFVANPIGRWFVRRATPPPQQPSSCAQLGEDCSQRACSTGVCAAPREYVNGQWRTVNWRCIDQQDYNQYCVGRGNTPAPWGCVTSQMC